jgi:hypothetical protein
LIPGLIVIGVGLLFLLDNFHVIYVRDWWRYWPVVLIAVGLVKLVDSTFIGGRITGGILLGLGAIFLGQNLGFYYVGMHNLWPLFLIGAGLLMLGSRVWSPQWHGPPEGRGAGLASFSTLNEFVIFSGSKRNVTTQDFQGGHLAGIFGGFEVDLRKADMAADSAVLEINTIFGGAEVRIPETWCAVVQGIGIFGGFGDHTVSPDPRAPGVKRLFVRGSAIFGGVGVKN